MQLTNANREWIHCSELDAYLKSVIENRSFYRCEKHIGECLNLTNEKENDKVNITIAFDLYKIGDMIYAGGLNQWIESLDFCSVTDLQNNWQDHDSALNQLNESLELCLSIWPCNLRRF